MDLSGLGHERHGRPTRRPRHPCLAVEGMILGAEAAAEPDLFGVMRPKDALLYASQVFQQACSGAALPDVGRIALIQLPATWVSYARPARRRTSALCAVAASGGRERVKSPKRLWAALGSEFARVSSVRDVLDAGEPAAIQGCEIRTFYRRPRKPWLIVALRVTTLIPVAG